MKKKYSTKITAIVLAGLLMFAGIAEASAGSTIPGGTSLGENGVSGECVCSSADGSAYTKLAFGGGSVSVSIRYYFVNLDTMQIEAPRTNGGGGSIHASTVAYLPVGNYRSFKVEATHSASYENMTLTAYTEDFN